MGALIETSAAEAVRLSSEIGGHEGDLAPLEGRTQRGWFGEGGFGREGRGGTELLNSEVFFVLFCVWFGCLGKTYD